MRKKWGSCWGGLPCLGVHKRGKRIVPASRAPDAQNQLPNGHQPTSNQPASIPPHLLAPPSSPASFSNSALQSTAQSPLSQFSMSATSPPGGSMFATGPYAHETQLVTPPDFSTFTTEPSTAPFTPPPELTHITTPSSPDVPYAQFLSSAAHLSTSYNPESPASSYRSGDCSPFPKSSKHSRTRSGRIPDTNPKSQASNFFCPATFAQYYLDQGHSGGGRLSISKESDSGIVNVNVNVNQTKSSKQDVEELEAYRASFGFSADEITTTPHYVEISNVNDDSFCMVPYTNDKPPVEEATLLSWTREGSRKYEQNSPGERLARSGSDLNGKGRKGPISPKQFGDELNGQAGNGLGYIKVSNLSLTDDEDIYSNLGKSKNSRNLNLGSSCSDAEIEYRRGRSLRECRKDLTWL